MEPLVFQGRLKVNKVPRSDCEFRLTSDRVKLYLLAVRPDSVSIFEVVAFHRVITHRETGWEPIFEHEGETLAEMEHGKKVR
jgi:hypothetical protein